MKQFAYLCLCLLLLMSQAGFANPWSDSWQCSVRDTDKVVWSSKSAYQKVALNIAFEACRKQSRAPQSCNKTLAICEGFNQVRGGQSGWRCLALDFLGHGWHSDYTNHRDRAALNAKSKCKRRSKVPETCYVNFITCANVDEGSLL